MRLLIALVLFTTLATACTTKMKQAEKLFEGGAFEDSARTYEEVLYNDPDNAEAQIGLKKARLKLIESKLIEVRLSRLAANYEQSQKMLLDVIKKEREWALYPSGAVAFTQQEESLYATKQIEQAINQALNQKFPLRAAFIRKTYEPVLESTAKEQQASIANRITTSGAASCEEQKRLWTTKKPYFSHFAEKQCAFWNRPLSKPEVIEAELAQTLWGELQLHAAIEGLPTTLLYRLATDLKAQLQKSIWYDPKSKNILVIKLIGALHFDRRQEFAELYHDYTVEEPYTAYEDVTKFREVPYLAETAIYNPQTQQIEKRGEWKTRTENYTEQVPVTRYKKVHKVFTYTGLRYSQMARLIMNGTVALGDTHQALAYSNEMNKTAIVHDVSMPHIGLSPQPLTLPDLQTWVITQSQTFSEQFQTQLRQAWIDNNCDKGRGQVRGLTEDELVFRCLRLPQASYPVFASRWFETNLGLSVAEANELLGFIRN